MPYMFTWQRRVSQSLDIVLSGSGRSEEQSDVRITQLCKSSKNKIDLVEEQSKQLKTFAKLIYN